MASLVGACSQLSVAVHSCTSMPGCSGVCRGVHRQHSSTIHINPACASSLNRMMFSFVSALPPGTLEPRACTLTPSRMSGTPPAWSAPRRRHWRCPTTPPCSRWGSCPVCWLTAVAIVAAHSRAHQLRSAVHLLVGALLSARSGGGAVCHLRGDTRCWCTAPHWILTGPHTISTPGT